MKCRSLIIGSAFVTLVFVILNAYSYFSEQSIYYTNLKESGMLWAGSWMWGLPFKMMYAGLGADDHSAMIATGFALNIITWVLFSMITGALIELVSTKLSKEI